MKRDKGAVFPQRFSFGSDEERSNDKEGRDEEDDREDSVGDHGKLL